MTKDRSSVIMDSIFAAPDQEGHGRLLKIIQDFLTSEAEKHSAVEKGVVDPESQRLALLTF
jgi:cohesin loading factor subunit SCC2